MQITWQHLHDDIASRSLDAEVVERRISDLWGQRDTIGSGVAHDFDAAERFVRALMPAAEIVMTWIPGLRSWDVLIAIPHPRLAATNDHPSAARALLHSAIEVMAMREGIRAHGRRAA